MRRLLVGAIAATSVTGAWSVATAAVPAAPARSTTATGGDIVVVEDARVCTAEQTEARSGALAASGASTVVSFTLVDPRCAS